MYLIIIENLELGSIEKQILLAENDEKANLYFTSWVLSENETIYLTKIINTQTFEE